jgi:hypothetical protein
MVGFGAQFNANLYADISAAAGVTPANVVNLEAKAVALAPRHVRIFWNSTATVDQVASFERVVGLAQQAGATINVTYWHGPYPDPAGQMQVFANELVHLVNDLGYDAVRYVTIQNEVNSTRVTQPLYEQLYRELDRDLRTAYLRERIQFVCGDLLQDGQASWFDYMATHMTDVCDGYSEHIYWNYFDTGRMVQRLTEVHDIVAALPPEAQKPLYITEYGVRGRSPNGEPQPGLYSNGQLLERTNENAYQHAWFSVLAARLGYVGTSKWDSYYGKYDNGTQAYYVIGAPQSGWPLYPMYNLLQLFTTTVKRGWEVVSVDSVPDTSRILAAYVGKKKQLTVIGLDTAGAQLNAGTTTATPYSIAGFPPSKPVNLLIWNANADGLVAPKQAVTADANGVVNVSISQQAVFVLTTVRLAASQ